MSNLASSMQESGHRRFAQQVIFLLKFIIFICLHLFLFITIPYEVIGQPSIPLPAEPRQEPRAFVEQLITGSPGAEADQFGYAVAISADEKTVIVGARYDDDGVADDKGSAYIFVRNGISWIQQTKLIAADGVASDQFGEAVALSADGNTAIIGASNDDAGRGAAYVFVRNGTAWTQQQKLLAADGAGTDFFGVSVALNNDGNTALVGAALDDVGASINQGSAYVFVRSGTVWTQQTRLSALNDGINNDHFGTGVALNADGNTALIGATMASTIAPGKAYTFTRSGTSWTQQAVLTALDGANTDEFGNSVALSDDGNTALIGAYHNDNGANGEQGSAYVFMRNGSSWTQNTPKLQAVDGDNDDQFGIAVALSANGTVALVGAYFDNVAINDEGSGYLFTRDSPTGIVWTQTAKLIANGGLAEDNLGWSVALKGEGNFAFLGAKFDDVGENLDQGSVASFYDTDAACVDVVTIPITECDTLVELYTSTGGDNWINHAGWLETDDPCTWTGITCLGGQVTGIELDGNGLIGSIPTSLDNLTDLTNLDLSFNQLSGTIPASLGDIDALISLKLNSNNLAGSIPDNLGTLPALQVLFLAHNQLSGSIPTTFGSLSSLISLGAEHNTLTGVIPVQLGNLTNLTGLDFNNNDLIGSIPDELGDLTNLLFIGLQGNALTGSIPPELGNLAALTELNLGFNKLEGNIPAEFGSLVSLQKLFLKGNALEGEIPVEIVLPTITQIDVDFNMLTSTNPTVITFLDTLNPTWFKTQTIPPTDVTAEDNSPNGLRVSWEAIDYKANQGHYEVICAAGTFTAMTHTVNKSIETTIFSSLPAGTYTCTVSTFTPSHLNNSNNLTSGTAAAAPIIYGGQDVPPNDPFNSPIVFEDFPQQNYSLNIENATRDGDPLPPTNNPNCLVSLPSTAVGIHYEIPGDLNTDGIVMNAGGPIWYSNRRVAPREPGIADTAIVVYEENASGGVGVIVACDDDTAPGEVSVSNVKFDLDPTKTYRAVVWNEADAPDGAIIEIAAVSFDLESPLDDSIALDAPTTFTWEPYAGAVNYYLKVARTSEIEPIILSVVLTPANDADSLSCDALLCTMTVAVGSDLANFMSNGSYLWSVGANMSATDTTIPLVNSNQIYRFVVGSENLPNLLTNGNFEQDNDFDKQPDGWTVKNESKDKLKCNNPEKIVAFEGVCAYVFKGGVGEHSTLLQKPDGSTLTSADEIALNARIKGTGIVAGTKILVNVKYTNGSSAKEKLNLTPGEIETYTAFSSQPIQIENAVSGIKVMIKNKNSTGKLFIDDLELTIASVVGVRNRSNELLPLPPVSGLTGSGQ